MLCIRQTEDDYDIRRILQCTAAKAGEQKKIILSRQVMNQVKEMNRMLDPSED